MSFALCFWICYLLALVLGLWSAWPVNKASGGTLLLFILLALLGWKVFGPPIHS